MLPRGRRTSCELVSAACGLVFARCGSSAKPQADQAGSKTRRLSLHDDGNFTAVSEAGKVTFLDDASGQQSIRQKEDPSAAQGNHEAHDADGGDAQFRTEVGERGGADDAAQ